MTNTAAAKMLATLNTMTGAKLDTVDCLTAADGVQQIVAEGPAAEVILAVAAMRGVHGVSAATIDLVDDDYFDAAADVATRGFLRIPVAALAARIAA